MLLFRVEGLFSNEVTLIEVFLLVLVKMKINLMKETYNFSHDEGRVISALQLSDCSHLAFLDKL